MTPALYSLQSLFFIPIQPPVHGIGITRFKSPAWATAWGESPAPIFSSAAQRSANVRPGIMIPARDQFLLLCA